MGWGRGEISMTPAVNLDLSEKMAKMLIIKVSLSK